ncbi:CD3337/EF1877 family mobilome membrane protein [Ligilactobacillus sp. LYQ135]
MNKNKNKKSKYLKYGLIALTVGFFLLASVINVHAESVKDVLQGYDMNEISKTLDSFNPYMKDGGITEIIFKAMNGLAGFFWEINRFIYRIFDYALKLMFGASTVNDAINNLIDHVTDLTGNLWDSIFGKFGIILFVLAVIAGFYHFAFKNERDGIKRVVLSLVIVGFSMVWFKNSSFMLKTFNSISTTAQGQLMTLDDSEKVKNASATDVVRKVYFEEAIERPYYLMNYGKTTAEAVQKDKQDPYEYLTTNYDKDQSHISDNVNRKGNKYTKKSHMYYKVLITLFSPLVSLAYGIPLFMVGFINLAVQIFALLLDLLLPVMALLSLIPKYSDSFFRGLMDVMMLFISKAVLVLAILGINLCQSVIDIIIPPNSLSGYFLNAFIFYLILIFAWKNRNKIIQKLTDGRLNQVTSKQVITTVQNQKEQAVQKLHTWNNRIERGKDGLNKVKERILVFKNGVKPNETTNDVSEAQEKMKQSKRTPQNEVTSKKDNKSVNKNNKPDIKNRQKVRKQHAEQDNINRNQEKPIHITDTQQPQKTERSQQERPQIYQENYTHNDVNQPNINHKQQNVYEHNQHSLNQHNETKHQEQINVNNQKHFSPMPNINHHDQQFKQAEKDLNDITKRKKQENYQRRLEDLREGRD